MDNLLTKKTIKKHSTAILVIVGIFAIAGLVLPNFLKPTYKVSSVISISPSYFQNSLMREFLSEVYDSSELRSQRQSLLNEALDVQFLDQVAEKTYGTVAADNLKLKSENRQALRRSIEVIPLQLSDFQISVTGDNREQALEINQSVLENVLTVLKTKRAETLTGLKQAIETQVHSISPTQPMELSENKNVLQAQISELEQQIKSNSAKFSSSHPTLIKQKKLLKKYQEQLTLLNAAKTSPAVRSTTNSISTAAATDDNKRNMLLEDLVRKLNYLNIVLQAENVSRPSYFSIVKTPELPLAPIWPKRSLFLIWFSLAGMLIAASYVLLKEILSSSESVKTQSNVNYQTPELNFSELNSTKARTETSNPEQNL